MFGSDIRGEAMRAGFGLGDFFHGMNEVRYAGTLAGHDFHVGLPIAS